MIKNYYSLSKLGKPYGLTYSKMAGVGLCSLLLCASPQVALADVSHADAVEMVQQAGVIKGTVVDNTGFPVIGAAVVVKGTTNGVVTDFDGNFELNAKVGDVIEISYVGYKTVTIKATAQPMNITMEEDAEQLDEVVVVGYGSTTKRDLIASVSTVKAEQISNMPVANIAQGLAGRSPGLIVQASGGGVNSTPSISIRGGGEPLYVIDGVIRSKDDFANLSPDDIQSMSILKDASATAVYGARATNGIVQIVTKKGKEGKVNIEYDFNQSFSQPSIWDNKLDSYDRAYWSNVAYENDGKTLPFTDDAIRAMKDGSNPEFFNNTNWRKLVLKDWAPQQKHTVRLTGGSDVSSFYVSLGHIDQNSLYKSDNHWMKRTNFRVQNTTNLKDLGVTINTAIDGYYQKNTHPNTSSANGYYAVFSHINDLSPLKPGVNMYGLPYDLPDNPVSETAADAGYNNSTNNIINGKGEIIVDMAKYGIKGLKLRGSSNYRYASQDTKSWRKDAAEYAWDSQVPTYNAKSQLSYSTYHAYSFTNQGFVDYNNQFGKHSISALAGFEQYYESYKSYGLSRRDFPFDIDQISIGDAETQTNSGSEGEAGRAAIIAQAKYNYDNKYYAEGSFRRDGSDKFAPGKRWGNFFSGSLGWVVTAEEFMQPLVEKNILNTLKLRASYGETGQDGGIASFSYLTSYGFNSTAYVVNGAYVPGFTEGALPSPDLTWYTTRQFDLGFDFASLNSRLYGSFDYFYYSTKGYLQTPTGETYLNTALGLGMPKVKSDSEHRREGIELQLGWRDNIGDFKYDVAANFTYFDQLMALDRSESENSYMNPYKRSQQQKGYYGLLLHNLGFYQTTADVYNSVGIVNALQSGNLLPGDIKYQDMNGDGKIDGEDQRRLGKSGAPRGQYGININLSYKGFYFSTLLQGSTRFDMYVSGELGMKTGQQGTLMLAYDHQIDHWRPDNVNAQYPRLMSSTGDNNNNNYESSDFWLLDGSYIRMKDFQFGYDFKYKLLKDVKWLTRCKVGVSGQNLFTISESTKYGLDPENSSTNNYGYPVERTLAFTLNLGF